MRSLVGACDDFVWVARQRQSAVANIRPVREHLEFPRSYAGHTSLPPAHDFVRGPSLGAARKAVFRSSYCVQGETSFFRAFDLSLHPNRDGGRNQQMQSEEGAAMQGLSRGAPVLGGIPAMLLACVAAWQVFVYPSASEAADGALQPLPFTTGAQGHAPAVRQWTYAESSTPAARPSAARAGTEAFSSVSPAAPMLRAQAAPPQSIASVPPYTVVGYFEAGGVRMAVLARGDAILLKKPGDEVGSEFRLVAIDPPALLHLPTGTLLPVRRQGEVAPSGAPPKAAPALASDPIIAGTAQKPALVETNNAAEIEADIARALATPAPPPISQSSFPLAR